jgi:hypothetical protein
LLVERVIAGAGVDVQILAGDLLPVKTLVILRSGFHNIRVNIQDRDVLHRAGDDRLIAGRPALRADEILINPVESLRCPDRRGFQVSLGMPDALAQDLSGLGPTISQLVDSEPCQVETTEAVRVLEFLLAREDLTGCHHN